LLYGPAHIQWLRPEALFGLESMDNLSHGVFWSLLFNISFYIWGSLNFKQSASEHNQAALFVDIFKYDTSYESSVAWRGKALVSDLTSLLSKFFGQASSERALNLYARRNQLSLKTRYAAPQLVNYTEKMLSGAIGAASARIVVSSVAKEERITVNEVIDILKTSQELRLVNQELTRKSLELEQTTTKLQQANELLKIADQQKDDFLSTVTHEIRTPLTSIRVLSEILQTNPDLEEEQRDHFLTTVIKETDRLTRLVNEVLDLERFESGRYSLTITLLRLEEVVEESLNSLEQLANEKSVQIQRNIEPGLPDIEGDYDRLVQVFINLISNSIKFCYPEIGIIRIKVRLEYPAIKVQIMDNGSGIDPLFHELIFDKFVAIIFSVLDAAFAKFRASALKVDKA
jgi:signal transduction histidine kinase